MEVVWKRASPVKAFSGAPGRRCSSPLSPCWEFEKGSGLQLMPLLTPPCQGRHPAPSPWRSGVFGRCSPLLSSGARTALLISHRALSQRALPFQASTRALGLYMANNWARLVITYFIPFVTAGSICSVERLLQLPTLPPIASLRELHFDPRYSWQLVASPTSALMFRD